MKVRSRASVFPRAMIVWAAPVRADSADGEDLGAAAGEQHAFAVGTAEQHGAGPKPYESANHIEGQSLRLNLLWRVVRRGDRQCRMHDDCVLNGLRKCAARKLAEAGCSESDRAITGHKTTRMVEEYTKAASKKRQASAAILKLERSEK